MFIPKVSAAALQKCFFWANTTSGRFGLCGVAMIWYAGKRPSGSLSEINLSSGGMESCGMESLGVESCGAIVEAPSAVEGERGAAYISR
ncbi:MAG: hypothetical protein HDS14_02390 [Bacteroides sp.]|nr:hypothetical protein [Bacteroides sp.]